MTRAGQEMAEKILLATESELPQLRVEAARWIAEHPEDDDVLGDALESWALVEGYSNGRPEWSRK